MRRVFIAGAAVVAGLVHSVLTPGGSFAGAWIGATIGYLILFFLGNAIIGAIRG